MKKFVAVFLAMFFVMTCLQHAAGDEMWELSYDDGEYEIFIHRRVVSEDYMMAVRFTPPQTPAKLASVSFYIYDLAPAYLKFFDANRQPLPHSIRVVPNSTGWVVVNLASQNIVVYGDFYVAVAGDPSATKYPSLGVDRTRPDERSYYVNPPLQFILASDVARSVGDPTLNGDFAIRVILTPVRLFSLEVGVSPRVGSLTVDGQAFAAERLPQLFDWVEGSEHVIGVPNEVVYVDEGVRYVFAGWGDGVKDNPRVIKVERSMRIIALWKRQFLLNVRSQYGSPSGGGWYDEGARANVVVQQSVEPSAGVRVLFNGWTGDVESPTPRIEILLDKPKTVEARWRTQYFLNVDSRGPVDGEGWYDAGSKAVVKANSPHVLQQDVSRLVFSSWTGDVSSTSPTLEIIMDKPKQITAVWKTQHRVEADLDPSKTGLEVDEWFDEGAVATLQASPEISFSGGKSRYVFQRWSDGSGEASRRLVVDKPYRLTAEYELQHRLDVISEHGQTAGSGWYRHGETASFSITPTSVPAGFLTYQVFDGWRGDFQGQAPNGSTRVDGPKTVQAIWRTDSSQLFVLAGVVAAVALAGLLTAARVRRRRAANPMVGKKQP